MKNKITLLLLCSILLAVCVKAQERLWNDFHPSITDHIKAEDRLSHQPRKYRLVRLNSTIAQQLQQLAPMDNPQASFPATAVPFGIPLPEGGMHPDIISESPLLPPDMQQQYPSIRTYRLRDEKSKRFTGRITITPDGVSGLLFTDSGAAYLSPAPQYGAGIHEVYYVKDIQLQQALKCLTIDQPDPVRTNDLPGSPLAGDCQLRTYRVAVAATGEYTQWAGGVASAVSAITTTINDVSAIYERDATIRFVLVNNTSVIYSNPNTDPFPTLDFPDGSLLNNNHSVLVTNIGSGNFDVGMIFSRGWNGGLARLNSACNSGTKGCNAAGLTFGTGANPQPGPQGPVFIGTVAHEIGHQFSATHSFAATNGSCNGNASEYSAWEPGGGSTIMAYAGSCEGNSYQNNSDLYFHGGTIGQISNYAVNFATCATITGTNNTPPVISVAATSYTIPPGTPFELSAVASDASSLQYCWEQLDGGALTNAKPSATAVSGPLFRSFPPNGNPNRVFPNMNAIVANTIPDYEVLPAIARLLHFRLTVRDGAAGGGCTSEASVTVSVAGAVPFRVSSQNTATSWTANGVNTAVINWNPGGTESAPVNCTAVDILFSTDGGFTYPYTLASAVPNNGSATIIIPNLSTTNGRIRVQAVNNIFFDINNGNITIISGCAAEGARIVPENAVTAEAGDASLDLTLSPAFGMVLSNSFNGQLAATDPKSSLVFNQVSAGNCQLSSNVYQYDRYRFMVNKAGVYTFIIPGATHPAVMNLYQSVYDLASPCTNYLNSNATRMTTSVNVNTSFAQELSPGIYYELTVGTFNASSPALPLNYTVTVSNTVSGTLWTNFPPPGAGFSYTYVIVSNVTGLIKAFDVEANLSNASNYPKGSYAVYGLSYSNSITANTLNAYIGGSFNTFRQDILNNPATLCANISDNAVQVTVEGSGPAELLPLSATFVNNSVVLKWATQLEQGAKLFEIHRSTDGSNFVKLPGDVPAKGNSTTRTDYSYTDNSPAAGVNYYRVRQVDQDGQDVMSNIVRTDKSDRSFLVRLRPNPLKRGPLYVDYISEQREDIRIMITDSKGRIMLNVTENARTGMNNYRFDVMGYAKGVYFVTVRRSLGILAERFVKD